MYHPQSHVETHSKGIFGLNLDKRSHIYGLITLLWIIGMALFLASCTVKPEPVSLDQQLATIERDLEAVLKSQKPVKKPLTLYQAMARAVQNNFEQRLQAYEMNIDRANIDIESLKMLPELNIGYTTMKRTNDPLVNFRAADNNAQVLETVAYDDQSKQMANLELSWNILDFGLSYARARQHADRYLLSTERRRKILQGLIQETRVAYYRAAAADKILDQTQSLIRQAKNNLDKARHIEESGLKPPHDILDYQASLLESIKDLMERRNGLIEAKLQLAHLINMPVDETYEIQFDKVELEKNIPNFDVDLSDVKLYAFLNRPELKEELYNQRIAKSYIDQEVFNTLPGIGVSVEGNYDSNSILEHTNWLTLAAGFAGNLMKIFTLEDRMEKAELQEKLVELRREALVAAVLSQIKMSHQRYLASKQDYAFFQELGRVSQRLLKQEEARLKADTISPADLLKTKVRSLSNEAAQYFAYIDLHTQYARMVSTMGIDVIPSDYALMETDQLAQEIEMSFNAIDPNYIKPLMDEIREHAKAIKDGNTTQKPKLINQPQGSPNSNNNDVEPANPTLIAPVASIGIMEAE
ncbi:MAG: hypothetical protein CMP22_04680 [Rickettsiales bacterium]|nr:hypothetical protein [Rickettsiales bacterium]